MSAAQLLQSAVSYPEALIGRSFVLGLPDSQGLFRVGLERHVWKIPAGGYAVGDRVKIIAIENDLLAVEKVAA